MAERVRGIVIKIVGTSSLVAGDDGLAYRCDLRGRLFRREKVRLAVGDRVQLLPSGAGAEGGDEGGERHGVIEAVEPRRTALRRARDFKRDQVLVANVERVFVCVAVFDPPYKRAFLDRLVVGCERDGIEPALVFNKVDTADDEYRELIEEDAAVYGDLGYEVFLTSAGTGEGIDALREAFRGRVSAVVGPSGVGKSSLLNCVCPGLQLRIGEVSDKDGRGRHTTTSAELVALAGGGFVVDTPGLRGFGLWDVTPDEVPAGFREVAARAPSCRFTNCIHVSEPGCAVREAVAAGEIDEERYQSYLRLREEVAAEAADRQTARRR